MLFALCMPIAALPINVNIMDNYFYNSKGEAVSAPVAYRPVQVKGAADLTLQSSFAPVDMLYFDDKLYILDAAGAIHILDEEYNLERSIWEIKDSTTYYVPDIDKYIYDAEGNRELDSSLARANKYAFNGPQGFYIDKEGTIYVADTGHRRVVVIDQKGVCQNVIQSVRVNVLGIDYVFKPQKLVVDSTGDIRILAYGVNRGFLTVDANGKFVEFFGLPSTVINVADWIYVLFSDTETLQARVSAVTAEYTNAVIDNKGFIYAVTADTSTGATPLRKLSSDGSDTLNQEGATTATFGDLSGTSVLVDVAVNEENNTYTVLDAYSGRFFTYDGTGRLLYLGGGAGSQYGRFKAPTSIVARGDELVVADSETNTLTIFELTDYAKKVNNAIIAANTSDNDKAVELWTEVTKDFSNMHIAYTAMANIRILEASSLDDEDPLKTEKLNEAMDYFVLGDNKDGYSTAFKEVRNLEMSKYFTVIFISVIVLIVGVIALIFIRKYRKERLEEKRRAGL